MSYVLGICTRNGFVVGSDTRCTFQGKEYQEPTVRDDEKKIFVCNTLEGPALFALTGVNRFRGVNGKRGPSTLGEAIQSLGIHPFHDLIFKMADFLESVILDNQACQVLAVSSYSYRHVVRIDVKDKKSQVIVDRMKYGQITVLGDAFACRFTLDHFPNMETESYPDQADAICDWIDSMIRMESEFPNLFKIPSSIGGKADVYVVGDGRIMPYT